MSPPPVLAFADELARRWAARGGPAVDTAIALRHDGGAAIAELAHAPQLDDAGRRGALGALARAADAREFGYLADTRTRVGDEATEAYLCLELAIVDLEAGTVGAAAHLAPYTRRKRLIGKATLELQPFERLESPEFGGFVGELAATWSWPGDEGRVRALNVLMQSGVELVEVDPELQAEWASLIAAHEG